MTLNVVEFGKKLWQRRHAGHQQSSMPGQRSQPTDGALIVIQMLNDIQKQQTGVQLTVNGRWLIQVGFNQPPPGSVDQFENMP